MSAGDCLRRHGLRRLAGAEDRHRRSGKNRNRARETFSEPPRLHSSSRTDTGVHALGMVAHFEVPRPECRMSTLKLALALNAWLPDGYPRGVRAPGAPGFSRPLSGAGQTVPLLRLESSGDEPVAPHEAWHVPRPLDVAAMRAAARLFVGRHDFQSFTANQGYARGTTCAPLTRCDVKRSGPQFTFIIEGDGFLYKMCRALWARWCRSGRGSFRRTKSKSCSLRRTAGWRA